MKAVIVQVNVHVHPLIQVVHSHDYRVPDQFDNKKVVVIGIGNSGGDISVELSRRAKQVRLNIIYSGTLIFMTLWKLM